MKTVSSSSDDSSNQPRAGNQRGDYSSGGQGSGYGQQSSDSGYGQQSSDSGYGQQGTGSRDWKDTSAAGRAEDSFGSDLSGSSTGNVGRDTRTDQTYGSSDTYGGGSTAGGYSDQQSGDYGSQRQTGAPYGSTAASDDTNFGSGRGDAQQIGQSDTGSYGSLGTGQQADYGSRQSGQATFGSSDTGGLGDDVQSSRQQGLRQFGDDVGSGQSQADDSFGSGLQQGDRRYGQGQDDSNY